MVRGVAGLAELAPGPALCTALVGITLSEVGAQQVVAVLRAQSRQLAHEQARMWASLVEVGLAVPQELVADAEEPDLPFAEALHRAEVLADWAPGEIAAALTWTHRSAAHELSCADTVVRDLPQVFTALAAGHIDRGKAVVFAEFLNPASGDLTAAQAQRICARLVPLAPRLTTSQLRRRLRRALLAIDPKWARRRYVRAVRGRAVSAVLDDEGTVTLAGCGLPAEEAAAACDRVDRLAEATKRAGHHAHVARIAADVFLGLLDGRFHGMSEQQITATLLANPRPEDTPTANTTANDNDDHSTGNNTGELPPERRTPPVWGQ